MTQLYPLRANVNQGWVILVFTDDKQAAWMCMCVSIVCVLVTNSSDPDERMTF